MNTIFKKLTVAVCLMSVSLTSFATEKITLDEMRQEVLNENIDVKIQYEKYYQAEQNIKVKLGDFLPSLDFQLLYWNTTYSLLYSVVPTPSGWFEYQSSKELAIAEKYVTDSIKLNILRDLTLSYINIKHQELMRISLEEEEVLLKDALDRAQKLEDLGVGSAADTFTAKRALMQHQQQIFVVDSVMAAEKEALMLALGKKVTSDVELADFMQDTAVLPENVEDAIELGLSNAPELKANTFMAEGAKFMTKSAKWSFVSFSGIGFGYPAALRIEKSKAREIALKREKITSEITNQITYAYTQLANLAARIENQKQIVEVAEENYNRVKELYDGGQATLEELIKAQKALYEEQRALTSVEMERELEVAKTKRLLGLDATQNKVDVDAYEHADLIATASDLRFGRKGVSVNIEIADQYKDQIVSVVYSGDIFNKRLLNISGNFSLYTKVKVSGVKTIKATILLFSGEKVELITSVNL